MLPLDAFINSRYCGTPPSGLVEASDVEAHIQRDRVSEGLCVRRADHSLHGRSHLPAPSTRNPSIAQASTVHPGVDCWVVW